MKKYLIVLLSVLLALALVGCGTASKETTTEPPAQEEAEEKDETTAKEPGDKQSLGDDIKDSLEEGAEGKVTAGDTTMEYGGDWPSYALLNDIPKPSVGTVATSEEVAGKMAGVMLVDMTMDDCKEYTAGLPDAGFDQNVVESDMQGIYSFSADNADGLHIDCGYVSESVMIQVSVIEE